MRGRREQKWRAKDKKGMKAESTGKRKGMNGQKNEKGPVMVWNSVRRAVKGQPFKKRDGKGRKQGRRRMTGELRRAEMTKRYCTGTIQEEK